MTHIQLDRVCEAYLTAQFKLSTSRKELDLLLGHLNMEKNNLPSPAFSWQVAKINAMSKQADTLRSLIFLFEKDVREQFDKIVHTLHLLEHHTARIKATEPATGQLREFEFTYSKVNDAHDLDWKLVG